MASRYPFPLPAPGEFRREKFRTKSTLQDYLVYGLVLVGVVALVGAGVYFFTRPPREQKRLRDEFIAFFTPKSEPMEIRVTSRKAPDLDDLDRRETAVITPPPPLKTPPPAQEAATAYSGGGPNRVLSSAASGTPKPGPAFLRFVQTLKVSSIVPGASAKGMLNGRLHDAGDVLDHDLGIIFVGVDDDKKVLVFRDKTGAELRLTY